MKMQQKIRKFCEKRRRNFTLETLKLIGPESLILKWKLTIKNEACKCNKKSEKFVKKEKEISN